jgi:hypothetical protein
MVIGVVVIVRTLIEMSGHVVKILSKKVSVVIELEMCFL